MPVCSLSLSLSLLPSLPLPPTSLSPPFSPLLSPSSQYIDSADLEAATLQEEPVKYHEAWQKLCSAK